MKYLIRVSYQAAYHYLFMTSAQLYPNLLTRVVYYTLIFVDHSTNASSILELEMHYSSDHLSSLLAIVKDKKKKSKGLIEKIA